MKNGIKLPILLLIGWTTSLTSPTKLPAFAEQQSASTPVVMQSNPVGIVRTEDSNDRQPVNIYAKPFNHKDIRPRIGIVVTGLGLSDAATEAAIQALPGGVTLAFAPYSAKLDSWIRLAHASGHEVLIDIPMEPNNFPPYDPGPQALLTSQHKRQSKSARFSSQSGNRVCRCNGFPWIPFHASRKHMLRSYAINQRGLLYFDSGSSPGSTAPSLAQDLKMPFSTATLMLDESASRQSIDRKFTELEKQAKSEKQAIGVASPYPVTFEKISNWAIQLRARGLCWLRYPH